MSDSHPAACENCTAPLQGPFCHACGQPAHSPVRSFGHALEEVFESFWHLDGRIFRTLRRLLLPGALARDYLAGQRAPYVAPMRLFVILCVLTFFVGKLVDFGVQANVNTEQATPTGIEDDLARAATAAEVRQIRDQAIAQLEEARSEVPALLAPARNGFDQGIAMVRRQADRRIVELGGHAEAPRTDAVAVAAEPRPSGWLERQALRMERNLPRIQDDPALFKGAFLGSVPTALFVLVPLFALLLKLFYLGSGRLYLEHLVVALYSHAFLCLALLGQFALMALQHLVVPDAAAVGVGVVLGLLSVVLWLWMPAYLLLMQKRVYGQGWALTTFKFVALGGMYALLLGTAALALVALSLLRA